MRLDLTTLNEAQLEAVTTTDGPLLVLAGAGSGKTRVLTFRIAYLLSERGAYPHEILAITFTNKAAAEMRERLATLVGPMARGMWVSTFHSMCVRMLRGDAERLGYTKSFSIYDADDAKRMVKSVMQELNFDEKKYPVNSVVGRISAAKNELVAPNEFGSKAFIPLDKAVAKIYPVYQRRLQAANAMDFDDLLVNCHRLLAEHPDVLAAYQDRFKWISVDEYQDTNHAQYSITNLLASRSRNLMVVGDDDQSIYSWRGADIRNILEFEQDYPEARVVKLMQNYRSTARILAAANAVVANNENRKPKELYTTNAEGEKIAAYLATDERDEARFIAAEIERLSRAEHRGYDDFAIFYRTNAQSRVLEDRLLREGVPYRIVGGTRFFDRAEIRDVMAYLKVINNPADEISLKRIINTPRRGIGDSTIDKVEAEARMRDVSFETALESAVAEDWLGARPRTHVHAFIELLRDLRTPRYENLRDEVESVIERTGLIDALEAERTDEAYARVENIKEFFSVVGEFAENHDEPDLPAFLEWLALRTDLDTLAEGEESVTMMTVHTAKGLEYPVVFVAGLEESIFPHSNSMFDPEGIEEERRLAYVAITRARERLYLTNAQCRSLYGATQHNPPSRFIGEIPNEHVESTGAGSSGITGTGYAARGDRRPTGGAGPTSGGGRVFGSGRSGGFGGSAKKEKPAAETFDVGDMVEHKVFGTGTVTSVNGDKITISFRSAGTKNLLVGYAPIRKLAQ